jgi:exonuclease VII large subunit
MDKVQEKLKEFKEKIKEEVKPEIQKEALVTKLDSLPEDIVENLSGVFEASAEGILDKFSDKIVESLSKQIEKLTLENAKKTEELNNVKQDNKKLTTLIEDYEAKVEHLNREINESSESRIQEVEEVKEENAKLSEELNGANVKLKVYEILDTNIPARRISDSLLECTSIEEVDKVLGIFEGSVGKAVKANSIVEDIRGAGYTTFDHVDGHKNNKKLTEEQKEQRYIAGLDD